LSFDRCEVDAEEVAPHCEMAAAEAAAAALVIVDDTSASLGVVVVGPFTFPLLISKILEPLPMKAVCHGSSSQWFRQHGSDCGEVAYPKQNISTCRGIAARMRRPPVLKGYERESGETCVMTLTFHTFGFVLIGIGAPCDDHFEIARRMHGENESRGSNCAL
jgi:hypothetical protein